MDSIFFSSESSWRVKRSLRYHLLISKGTMHHANHEEVAQTY